MIRVAGIAVASALFIITFFLFPPVSTSGALGLCLPSPNQWHLPHLAAWAINTALVYLSAILLASANKKYNFVAEADPIVSLALLILMGCNCLATSTLSTAALLLFANIAALFVLISTYESRNATREFFIIGTIPAIGAMFQYGFLLMIPVFLGGGLLMKSLRIREFIAFIFGLVAPYWIAVGLGWISPSAFRIPESLVAINTDTIENDLFFSLLLTGIMALSGLVMSLYNFIRLYTKNSRLRCMHFTFNLMGYASIVAIIFDFDNFIAYSGLLTLWTAIQFGTLLCFYNIRRSGLAFLVLLLIFLPIYILSL